MHNAYYGSMAETNVLKTAAMGKVCIAFCHLSETILILCLNGVQVRPEADISRQSLFIPFCLQPDRLPFVHLVSMPN